MKAGTRTWADKFRNAFRGLRRTTLTQSSFRVHLMAATAVIAGGFAAGVTAIQWCLLLLAVGLVMTAELFNTAIESLARGPSRRRHPRLRDALDIASAAVLVASIAAALIGWVVFVNRPG